ncbi:TPA: hypothetical protein ACPOOM_000967 [Haemophilus influenzae]|uniref:hypothetical protein n=2 Tax=Haemophilus influenzae TaxID=727 RepID=UPI0013148FA9|nr:hypothetical protein [Haemophilus influenzae]
MPKVFHLIHLKMLVVMCDFHRQSWSSRLVSSRLVSSRLVSSRLACINYALCKVIFIGSLNIQTNYQVSFYRKTVSG